MTALSPFGADLGTMLPAEPGSAQIKAVFNGFPAAVGALAALVDGQPHGLVATSVTVGVSYDPPMVLFSVSNDSTTWPRLRRARRIGISVLGEDQGRSAGSSPPRATGSPGWTR